MWQTQMKLGMLEWLIIRAKGVLTKEFILNLISLFFSFTKLFNFGLDCLGVIVTAPGNTSDFVSRFFAPRAGVPEDPVTGSAHSTLISYWSNRLNKKELHAFQLSQRGGELFCENLGERVKIAGNAVLYSEGVIYL